MNQAVPSAPFFSRRHHGHVRFLYRHRKAHYRERQGLVVSVEFELGKGCETQEVGAFLRARNRREISVANAFHGIRLRKLHHPTGQVVQTPFGCCGKGYEVDARRRIGRIAAEGGQPRR